MRGLELSSLKIKHLRSYSSTSWSVGLWGPTRTWPCADFTSVKDMWYGVELRQTLSGCAEQSEIPTAGYVAGLMRRHVAKLSMKRRLIKAGAIEWGHIKSIFLVTSPLQISADLRADLKLSSDVLTYVMSQESCCVCHSDLWERIAFLLNGR